MDSAMVSMVAIITSTSRGSLEIGARALALVDISNQSARNMAAPLPY